MRGNNSPKKEVLGTMKTGETCTLAEFTGTGWSLMNSHWLLRPRNYSSGVSHIFELVGNKMVSINPLSMFAQLIDNYCFLELSANLNARLT